MMPAAAVTAGPLIITRLGARGDGIARSDARGSDIARSDARGGDVARSDASNNHDTVPRSEARGDGRPSGPVYVARALPGERVEGAIEGDRMAAPRILTPSAHRVTAPCRHYGACGGCALQHADDAFVAEWKRDQLRDALARVGIAVDIGPVLTSPPGSRRRAVLHGRRTKKGVVVGFHGHRSATVTAVPECLVLSDGLRAALPGLEALVQVGGSRKAEMALTVTQTPQGPDVAVEGGKPVDAVLLGQLAGVADQARFARLSWNGEVLALRDRPVIALGPAGVTPPPGGFLQATAEGEAALVAAVLRMTEGARRVADLFAGCGTFALPLAARAEVHAVEGDAALTEALAAGWRGAGGLHALNVETRDLFRRPLLPEDLARFDAVVIDPPRAGAVAQMAELARSAVPRIAAVSCNPASFARDAALLIAGGYRLEQAQVVDQFRWSPHIELVALFARP
ncbi:MAG: class I SAM-dependent RNA methyltransferase [Qingshengfaniella sp.]